LSLISCRLYVVGSTR